MTATIAANDIQPGQMVFDYALNQPIEVEDIKRYRDDEGRAWVKVWFTDGMRETVEADNTYDLAVTRHCVDSGTQVMVPASPGDTVTCGNCGSQSDTYVRPGDSNEIPFIASHDMALSAEVTR